MIKKCFVLILEYFSNKFIALFQNSPINALHIFTFFIYYIYYTQTSLHPIHITYTLYSVLVLFLHRTYII